MGAKQWLAEYAIPDVTNRFNFRGNLDFKINEFMKMGVNASARLNLNERPNLESGEEDYWNKFSSVLPNAYPVLWNPSLITDPVTREMVLSARPIL